MDGPVAARSLAVLAACLFASLGQDATAQTTDGYHALQVLPIVVDTASFAQRIVIRNPNQQAITLGAMFRPAEGTAQAALLTCPGFEVAADSEVTFASLRALCPALAAGSNFGMLQLGGSGPATFSVYSRVSNPAGEGFSVEAFPAHVFTSATSVVTGLRRSAATADAPAFQSNCFVGNPASFGYAGTPTDVEVSLRGPGGMVLGTTVVPLVTGRLVRLLDVFAAVGAAAGDHLDATATFRVLGEPGPAIAAFCTVQDNTHFGADFRIAKQELAWDSIIGSQDLGAIRNLPLYSGLTFSDGSHDTFTIEPGKAGNAHLFYFRHPDLIGCRLFQGSDLEIRLRAPGPDGQTWQTVAGGNDISTFVNVYLGDKPVRGSGANVPYLLEVERRDAVMDDPRSYVLQCFSGSGHTGGEKVASGLPNAF